MKQNELHGWIYGCDICQEICPWNEKFAQKTNEGSFLPKVENIELDERRLGSVG